MNQRFPEIKVTAEKRQVGGSHYLGLAVQPWDVIDTWPLEQRIGAYRAGALKYLMRMGSKDESEQEIGKGKHYMEKLLEVLAEIDPAKPEGWSGCGNVGMEASE